LTLSTIGGTTLSTAAFQEIGLTDQEAQVLSTQKVFFGHQSVGDNIVHGIQDIMASDPRTKLSIVDSRNPEAVPAPAFMESHIGQNTDPRSKNSDFLAIIRNGFAGIAMFKYCYIDVDETTDVQQMFSAYQATIEEVRRNHPQILVVHITVPLTTVGSPTKAWVKSMLGKNTAQDDNIKRNHFNSLLLQAYGKDPTFDLATVESTHIDGSRSYFKKGSEMIYTLAPEYTTDGGHLNQAGRRIAAESLLVVLAKLQ
jgi:lysophospholipase L1-like esterase